MWTPKEELLNQWPWNIIKMKNISKVLNTLGILLSEDQLYHPSSMRVFPIYKCIITDPNNLKAVITNLGGKKVTLLVKYFRKRLIWPFSRCKWRRNILEMSWKTLWTVTAGTLSPLWNSCKKLKSRSLLQRIEITKTPSNTKTNSILKRMLGSINKNTIRKPMWGLCLIQIKRGGRGPRRSILTVRCPETTTKVHLTPPSIVSHPWTLVQSWIKLILPETA